MPGVTLDVCEYGWGSSGSVCLQRGSDEFGLREQVFALGVDVETETARHASAAARPMPSISTSRVLSERRARMVCISELTTKVTKCHEGKMRFPLCTFVTLRGKEIFDINYFDTRARVRTRCNRLRERRRGVWRAGV